MQFSSIAQFRQSEFKLTLSLRFLLFFCVGRQLFFNRSSAYCRNKQTFAPSRFRWRHKVTLNLCNWRNKHVQKIQRGTFVSVVVVCPVSLLSDWLFHLISSLVFPTHALVSFSLSIGQLLITVNWRLFQLFFFVQFFVVVVQRKIEKRTSLLLNYNTSSKTVSKS